LGVNKNDDDTGSILSFSFSNLNSKSLSKPTKKIFCSNKLKLFPIQTLVPAPNGTPNINYYILHE
jgi:hypothetical protein